MQDEGREVRQEGGDLIALLRSFFDTLPSPHAAC